MTKNNLYVLDYIGAKNKLAPDIAGVMEEHLGKLNGANFTEIFAGTGALSRWLLRNRYPTSITTNDFENYSRAVCLAATRDIQLPPDIYSHLNNLPPRTGFITETCSPYGAGRMFFTDDNGRRIDAIRCQIRDWYNAGQIDQCQSIKLLGELVMAADKVSNTSSIYGAFLKKFKKTALKPVVIKDANPNVSGIVEISNLMLDANEAILHLSGDVLYVDPPYNARQYGNNYHVLNYISDLNSEVKYAPRGVTGVPKNWQRSDYCNSRKVAIKLDHLIKNAKFPYIIFSYNNRGLLPLTTLKTIFRMYCDILEVKAIEYKNFRADNNRTYDSDRTTEYVIVLKKREVNV